MNLKVLIRKFQRKFNEKGFRFTEKIFNFPKESDIFFEKHGYLLNLKNPQSFSEKVIWKKIFDRNPLLPIVSDKLRVREYLKEKLGTVMATEVLVPLYFHSCHSEMIPFNDLPDQFVIKPNHASGKIIFIYDKSTIDQDEIITKCKVWLSQTYGVFRHEWAYQEIKPEVLVEKLLLDKAGNIPVDFKFHVFHGKCRRIAVCSGRFEGGRKVTSFDERWNHSSAGTSDPEGPAVSKPEQFNKMLDIAQKLGEDFDYIRVDLYNIEGRIYFGELTSYPLSGDNKYTPIEFDFELGSYWKINRDYWKNNHIKNDLFKALRKEREN
jgi:hypothetical protein